MVNIIVAGAAGRMGRMIVSILAGHPDCALTGAFDRAGHPSVGQDAGVLAGMKPLGVPLADDPAPLFKGAGVMIDFTGPDATVSHAAACAAAGVAMVIGTTGLDESQKAVIRQASKKVPVVLSPNMSVGVNLAFKIIAEVAGVLGEDYDLEIIEAHHRLKKDSPSGTAARMLEILAEARGTRADRAGIYGRHGLVGPRPAEEIGVHAVRGGDIVGDHTVLFAGPGERIEITHRAHSRETFARGAVRAALWVAGRPPGFHDMADVLGLK